MSETAESDRRPLKTRNRAWAQALTRTLVEKGVHPNHISLASIAAAFVAASCFFMHGYTGASHIWLLFAAIFVQLRLLCNMLDGMVAIEGGNQTQVGAFYNEFPDRISDILILTGFGLAAGHETYHLFLGSLSAMLALLTAYVRALGASLHGEQDFSGPFAKPHRMACLTVIAVLLQLPMLDTWSTKVLLVGNWLLIIGIAFTILRRSRHLLKKLELA